ncbi:MAG: hypothetical protein HKM98_03680 [Gammaproteobacteria bacterium]|nr:hypothetical protein [Gammaproteobacteria bacterium]
MKLKLVNFTFVCSVALGTLLTVASTAQAASCSPGAAGAVSGSVACDAGSQNNDNPLPEQVNADMIHGISDWEYAGKVEFGDSIEAGDVDIGFMIGGGTGGDTQNGTWSIDSNAWSLYSNIMIVLKNGVGNNTQENYVGYLLDGVTTSGTYTTPFFNDGNMNPKDISHITLYVADAVVPVPAALPLFISALGASAWFGRKKRSAGKI